jgi:serine/threonine-protein kinase
VVVAEPGRTLSHYSLVEKIGAGGMGEVWKAQDSVLDRSVAVKILPPVLAEDSERLARFRREAKLLASLNHPHIAAIHGFEESENIRFLVLELVPGETLAEMLARGALSVEEALDLSGQIAEALEAAHRSGIIHRDLKPANIKVTPEGKVKVLDFGLAKALDPEPSSGAADLLSHSPTVTQGATRAGVILGTAAYMSPEQARGRPVDRRADNWAFGCVLYEMLTGRQAFHGETVSDTIAAILRGDVDWPPLPPETPAGVRRLLRRCLTKDPNDRLQDIGDARIELTEAKAEMSGAAITVPERDGDRSPRSHRKERAIWIALGAVAGAILAGLAILAAIMPPPEAPSFPYRFKMQLPPEAPIVANSFLTPMALSPDGRLLVYVGAGDGVRRLYVRPRDRLEARPLHGTEDAEGPFLSPDGRWVGFYSEGKLKKISVHGGPAQEICDILGTRGAAWAPDGRIILTIGSTEGLYIVPDDGGELEPLTTLDRSKEEYTHRFPHLLPDGDTLIFSAPRGTEFNSAPIWAFSLSTGERRLLLEGGADARYLETGHLVFVQAGSLMAVPLDEASLEPMGPPVPVVEGVTMQGNTGAGHFATSGDGSLVYLSGGMIGEDLTLVRVRPDGQSSLITREARAYRWPHMSPDGTQLAVTVIGMDQSAIYIIDARDGSGRRFTFEGIGSGPVWSPDGRSIAFTSDRTGFWNAHVKPSDGAGPAKALTSSEEPCTVTSWSPDGQTVALSQFEPDMQYDIWTLSMEEGAAPRPFLKTPNSEGGAKFSPDGRWLAYISNESGSIQVYVTAYPGPGGKWQISDEGGTEPVWSRDGRRLFYRRGRHVMAVEVETDPVFNASAPAAVCEGSYEGLMASVDWANYDVHPDGESFVMVRAPEEGAKRDHVDVVLNWFDELKRRVPSGGE